MAFTLSGKSVLITGGTGSLGTALLERLLDPCLAIRQIMVFSRDELKQSEQKRKYAHSLIPIKWKLGDVRDYEALYDTCKGIDIIFHLAALKQVPSCEDNPEECVKTNIGGTSTLIRAANYHQVSKVVAVSTDKAVQPTNTYGASKFIMEQLLLDATLHSETQFSIGRLGNFLASRGSVFPLFIMQMKYGQPLSVTDLKMTRFCITEQEVADLLISWIPVMRGGEIFVPKMKSYSIHQIIETLEAEDNHILIGRRNGEKLNELLVAPEDEILRSEAERYYVIRKRAHLKEQDRQNEKAFVYQSDQKDLRYTNAELKALFNYVESTALVPAASTTTSEASSSETAKTTTVKASASPVS